MLVYPSGLDLSSSTLRFLTTRLRERRRALGTRWRRLSWGRWETLSAGQQAVNRPHAKTRALVEQAIATLKSWRLRKLRCATTRITSLVQAVLALLASSYR
ncbi:hypothetical protein AB0L71_24095 [Streptomyces sp. NPDC052052]|uniref:hypothetical protein n=1 Tax=Streptomyces sp. NPDC052052 TaxID=3154756 RepID=UPI00343E5C05